MSQKTREYAKELVSKMTIEEKMGLSAAQMIKNENIMEQLEGEAQEKINERLEHEINRILNGYGG